MARPETTIELDGHTFGVWTEYDPFVREPWKEEDGHGFVSEWTTRSKRPGERVLVKDRESYRYYDVQATMQRAIAERWDAPPFGVGTVAQRAARAVDRDYEYLRAWCNDEWHYIDVGVALLDDSGTPITEIEWIGGVEDLGDYWKSEAEDLASNILAEMAHEARERAFALTLGVRTT